MRVIIVDDEITSSQVLNDLVREHLPNLEVVAICNKSTEALATIDNLKPDLVFMDIEMPGLSGFDVLERLPEVNFDTIFTTAHSKYGIKAIQFSAMDYLLKPIETEELLQAVERVNEHRLSIKPLERIKLLLENVQLMNKNDSFNRIALPTADGLKFVMTNDIVRCMSSNNYTYIYLNTNEKILVSKTLKDMENILSSTQFCRVHNSHLINVAHIAQFHKGEIPTVIMKDNSEVEVSRRKKDELIKMFNL